MAFIRDEYLNNFLDITDAQRKILVSWLVFLFLFFEILIDDLRGAANDILAVQTYR